MTTTKQTPRKTKKKLPPTPEPTPTPPAHIPSTKLLQTFDKLWARHVKVRPSLHHDNEAKQLAFNSYVKACIQRGDFAP